MYDEMPQFFSQQDPLHIRHKFVLVPVDIFGFFDNLFMVFECVHQMLLVRSMLISSSLAVCLLRRLIVSCFFFISTLTCYTRNFVFLRWENSSVRPKFWLQILIYPLRFSPLVFCFVLSVLFLLLFGGDGEKHGVCKGDRDTHR